LDTITIVLVLILAVVVSGSVANMLPWPVPQPLLQITLGGFIGLLADFRVELSPDVFFLLFLPPLLFLDGWRIPKEEMLKDIKPILELSLGLVILTIVGVGFLTNWLIPAVPLAVAFALAAVVSPTDPIAVRAITARVPVPRRLMHILEGEALLNDASGLVCFRFATAAALTGSFSLYDAAVSFMWMACGGIALGVGATWTITRAKAWADRRLGEESGSQILVSLLIPFASYLLAEQLGGSGILAAVAAGVTMSFIEASGRALAVTRIRRSTVWDMIQFAANGIIFVLLGEQLPAILAATAETVRMTGHQDPVWLPFYVLAIYTGLVALRFLWVWVSLTLTIFKAGRRDGRSWRPNLRLVAAVSVAGVRGTITLAGVLTLPIALNNGAPFPARDVAILLAMGVIIVSLIATGIGLPPLLRGLRMPAESSYEAEEDRARNASAEAAITEIERVQHSLSEGRSDADVYVAAASQIMDLYRTRIADRTRDDEVAALARRRNIIESELLLAAVKAERKMIFSMAQRKEIGSETASKLIRELDLAEARYQA
jgi:monovalent cation/hydrogen antiporter